MGEAATIQQVYDELQDLKREVHYIKKHIVDPDTIMTKEEEKALQEAEAEYKAGNSVSLEDFKKEMSAKDA